MNFMEAVKAMKEGKKIRIKGNEDSYLFSKENLIYSKITNGEYPIGINQIEATDWEIVEETKTLSDEIVECVARNPHTPSNQFIPEYKVKQFNKDIKTEIKNKYKGTVDEEDDEVECVEIIDIINKKAGKRLI